MIEERGCPARSTALAFVVGCSLDDANRIVAPHHRPLDERRRQRLDTMPVAVYELPRLFFERLQTDHQSIRVRACAGTILLAPAP